MIHDKFTTNVNLNISINWLLYFKNVYVVLVSHIRLNNNVI
jgi:hypothetical protein